MPESSYLRFLPPVVWQDTPAGSEFSLGDALRVFEKILTGIDDQVPIVHHTNTRVADDESHTHVALTQQIASLHRLFDPWTTPPEFLPWLASWVSLRFPELQGRQLWDEYQRRKATAAMSRTHRRRGLRSGLDAILDLYAVGRVRPRLAVDDGSCLFSLRLGSDLPASVSALPTFRPLFDETQKPPRVVREGLMRPWCVARGPDGSLYVGEHGLPDDMPHRRRVWRLNAEAQQDVSGSPPLPRPLVPQQTLGQIVAVAVRPALAGQPETLFILERTGRILSVAAPYTADTATEVTNLASGSSVYTLAMAVDDKGDLLVLDRRQMPNEPAAPRVFVVRPSPVAVTSEEELDPAIVREPLSLFIDRDGRPPRRRRRRPAGASAGGDCEREPCARRPRWPRLDAHPSSAAGQPARRPHRGGPRERRRPVRPGRRAQTLLALGDERTLHPRPGPAGLCASRDDVRERGRGPHRADHRAGPVRQPHGDDRGGRADGHLRPGTD